jgi:hypothetical protein
MHCDWRYTGAAADGIVEARRHRELEHGVIVKHKRSRIGKCGLFMCNRPAVKRVQGRGLCAEHLDVVRENAERRGWTTVGLYRQEAA